MADTLDSASSVSTEHGQNFNTETDPDTLYYRIRERLVSLAFGIRHCFEVIRGNIMKLLGILPRQNYRKNAKQTSTAENCGIVTPRDTNFTDTEAPLPSTPGDNSANKCIYSEFIKLTEYSSGNEADSSDLEDQGCINFSGKKRIWKRCPRRWRARKACVTYKHDAINPANLAALREYFSTPTNANIIVKHPDKQERSASSSTSRSKSQPASARRRSKSNQRNKFSSSVTRNENGISETKTKASNASKLETKIIRGHTDQNESVNIKSAKKELFTPVPKDQPSVGKLSQVEVRKVMEGASDNSSFIQTGQSAAPGSIGQRKIRKVRKTINKTTTGDQKPSKLLNLSFTTDENNSDTGYGYSTDNMSAATNEKHPTEHRNVIREKASALSSAKTTVNSKIQSSARKTAQPEKPDGSTKPGKGENMSKINKPSDPLTNKINSHTGRPRSKSETKAVSAEIQLSSEKVSTKDKNNSDMKTEKKSKDIFPSTICSANVSTPSNGPINDAKSVELKTTVVTENSKFDSPAGTSGQEHKKVKESLSEDQIAKKDIKKNNSNVCETVETSGKGDMVDSLDELATRTASELYSIVQDYNMTSKDRGDFKQCDWTLNTLEAALKKEIKTTHERMLSMDSDAEAQENNVNTKNINRIKAREINRKESRNIRKKRAVTNRGQQKAEAIFSEESSLMDSDFDPDQLLNYGSPCKPCKKCEKQRSEAKAAGNIVEDSDEDLLNAPDFLSVADADEACRRASLEQSGHCPSASPCSTAGQQRFRSPSPQAIEVNTTEPKTPEPKVPSPQPSVSETRGTDTSSVTQTPDKGTPTKRIKPQDWPYKLETSENFEVSGCYREDCHMVESGSAKKKSRRRPVEEPKVKVKRKGIPNKHLQQKKAEWNTYLEEDFGANGENNEIETSFDITDEIMMKRGKPTEPALEEKHLVIQQKEDIRHYEYIPEAVVVKDKQPSMDEKYAVKVVTADSKNKKKIKKKSKGGKNVITLGAASYHDHKQAGR